jgi:hypothetical protein
LIGKKLKKNKIIYIYIYNLMVQNKSIKIDLIAHVEFLNDFRLFEKDYSISVQVFMIWK